MDINWLIGPRKRARLATTMRLWGPRGVVAFAVASVVVGVALLVAYIQGGEPLGDTGIGDVTVRVVPATGSQGFDTEVLVCDDKLTDVVAYPFGTPDSGGIDYQISRLKDGVNELVKVHVLNGMDQKLGTHYWIEKDPATGKDVQKDETAFVTKRALGCIQDKAKVAR